MKNIIKNYLTENNLQPKTLDDNEDLTLFQIGLNLKNGNCNILIDIRNDPEQVFISTYFPIVIPVENHMEVSELIIRINDYLNIGRFNLKLEKGFLYFKVAYLFNAEPVNHHDLFNLYFHTSFHFMDRYIPAFMSIIYANTKPLEAFNKIENAINPELN